VTAMHEALLAWAADPEVRLVVVDGAGERGLCAGGDIRLLYETGRTKPEIGRSFWRDEYRLNALIARYPKPYVVFMDGIVMGGGVGLSAHGSHRIVTERSVVAMPECRIGFLPDVGGTLLLARAPGAIGTYLGMTGSRMSGPDAILARFADHFVPSDRLAGLAGALAAGEPVDEAIAAAIGVPGDSVLADDRAEIDALFGHAELSACLARLAEADTPFAREAFATLRGNAPLSVASAFAAIKEAKTAASIEECLAREYRFAHRCLEADDIYEGVRAAVIERGYRPVWNPARLEEVTAAMVAARFAPLGAQELTFDDDL
jgi:enoyl-CoA hydratase